MFTTRTYLCWAASLLAGLLALMTLQAGERKTTVSAQSDSQTDWQLPDESLLIPFKDQQPIYFVNRTQNPAEWNKLTAYWNPGTEKITDPSTGQTLERSVVRIKVPLGLTQNPPIPPENPLTVAKWKLGKDLYFDEILSSDSTVACASCHEPSKGYTDQSPVSAGIQGLKGGMSAPSVFNSAFHRLQFWDGRAASLEDQAQGPVQNPVEMFDGTGHAWSKAVERVRKHSSYPARFRQVFGTEPTRDAIAKAIAAYERTVLSGNSIHDRAELAMRKRVDEEETGRYEFVSADYANALKEAFSRKDVHALKALKLDPEKDVNRIPDVAASINRGRALYFGKARCNSCHVGDNFTDNDFHNLGVGVKDGIAPAGRFGAMPTGQKNPELFGAFKTPTLRAIVTTAPYLHDGSENTLEKVVDFYDRGGNANEYLDVKMRDTDAERAFGQSREKNTSYQGPKVYTFGKSQKPIVPLQLGLTEQEKKDLVLFLRALEGDPADPILLNKPQS